MITKNRNVTYEYDIGMFW